ncbi:hypothetical protein B9Z55_022019 [Caenorhabditis nigoni]|uniref:G-protein coupled receptors family 1 profile domain-containing protein n=1 Tax=Caenorhabditis nigoni TaxID=1611254 RepID=A0A2G5TUL2_9PELO|nr:hypothetical protein B9Z55_022019 [Caenorhabditis nigoni]
MSLATFFLVFTFINFLAITFNIFLFILIFKLNDKTRHPTIYIYNTIIANTLDTFFIFVTFLLPLLFDEKLYIVFRNVFGSTLTFVCTFFYEHVFYLTLPMIIHRCWLIRHPESKAFVGWKLWTICGVLALTQFQNDFLFVIPLLSFVLNIIVVLYLAQKRGEALRRRRLNVVSISSTSNVHQLPPLVTRSKTRQMYEQSLLRQSLFTTLFSLIYELSGFLLRFFRKDYQALSEDTQRLILYARLCLSSLLCFLVFFVGTPAIRKLVITKVKEILRGKPGHRSPTATVLV